MRGSGREEVEAAWLCTLGSHPGAVTSRPVHRTVRVSHLHCTQLHFKKQFTPVHRGAQSYFPGLRVFKFSVRLAKLTSYSAVGLQPQFKKVLP